MTTYEEITTECFLERVDNFKYRYERLRETGNKNYLAFESIVYDLIFELKRDIKDCDNEKKKAIITLIDV